MPDYQSNNITHLEVCGICNAFIELYHSILATGDSPSLDKSRLEKNKR